MLAIFGCTCMYCRYLPLLGCWHCCCCGVCRTLPVVEKIHTLRPKVQSDGDMSHDKGCRWSPQVDMQTFIRSNQKSALMHFLWIFWDRNSDFWCLQTASPWMGLRLDPPGTAAWLCCLTWPYPDWKAGSKGKVTSQKWNVMRIREGFRFVHCSLGAPWLDLAARVELRCWAAGHFPPELPRPPRHQICHFCS